MAESDLTEIPTEVVRTALCETIETKLKSKNYKITITSASKAGESNFIGIVHRVTFNKEGEDKLEKLILKVAPLHLARRTQFNSRPLFLQEISTYNEILPFFRQFEMSKGVAIEENGFVEYPKCYRTIDEEPNECLFLEDLSVRGFAIIDRYTQEVTTDHVYLFMKALGKLHAISFALKDQQPEKFKELASSLKEMFLRANEEFIGEFFDKQAESIFKVLENAEDAHLLAKMKKVFENGAMNVALECLDLDGTDPGSVISHGDSWQNNLMFRYDKNGKPIEISLLDWQISRYSSPIIDIVYFMFCCTTKELRDDHYDDFLKVYHESLSAHIRRLGSDPEKLFPFAVMLEHFRKYAKFGLVLSTVLLPMITTDRGNGLDLDELAVKFEKNKENNFENKEDLDAFNSFISDNSRNKFNKRLRDVVGDMARLGYV
ncbi:uncharacterized protein LOC129565586 [Sitodiplosis mosellana]|uniref:uncharacterized protein LOC129565586 n=1 Tax=Sitodiplosis mosellana TaxID=263140 RepID=UPI0024451885|nr:uncharacterized protein LOC129565586 [Sitodiplosis mosellana]